METFLSSIWISVSYEWQIHSSVHKVINLNAKITLGMKLTDWPESKISEQLEKKSRQWKYNNALFLAWTLNSYNKMVDLKNIYLISGNIDKPLKKSAQRYFLSFNAWSYKNEFISAIDSGRRISLFSWDSLYFPIGRNSYLLCQLKHRMASILL